METSPNTGAIAAALAKAHLEIENPELDGVNPHFKSKFSTLAAVLNAVRKPLAKQGIALMQSVAIAENRVCVTTSMMHSSGEWMRETMSFPIPGNSTVQQAGSTVTYLRRYSLISLTAIVGDPHTDDDGEGDRRDRTERKPEPRREPFRPSEARGAPAPAPAIAPVAAPVVVVPKPRQESVAAADGEWVEIVPKYIDEGVAGKNSAPFVKVKDENGDNYFVWDTALFGTVKASKGSVLWAITEAAKKEGAPPRIVQVRTAPPAEPGSEPDSEIPF